MKWFTKKNTTLFSSVFAAVLTCLWNAVTVHVNSVLPELTNMEEPVRNEQVNFEETVHDRSASVNTRISTWLYVGQKEKNSNFTLAELANNITLFDSLFNNSLYPATSTVPWANVSTSSYYFRKALYSGYRNQMMAFTGLMLLTMKDGHDQFLIDSISHKDTHGSNFPIAFSELWDLEHWNSFYPKLPRLVQYDPIVFDQYDPGQNFWYRKLIGENMTWPNRDESTFYDGPTHPTCSGLKQHQLFRTYKLYVRGSKTELGEFGGSRLPAEILMLKGALRPHKDIREIINQKLQTLVETKNQNDDDQNKVVEYMTLHARIEPDMQKHPVCRDKKVTNLTQIIDFVERKWPIPPAPRVFLPINRAILEEEVAKMEAGEVEKDAMTIENLETLNKARDVGLWNGTVQIFEFGSHHLIGTKYEKRRSVTGALLNFFVAINAKVFVGSEVSSYAHDLLATRFFRNMTENYKYLPDGLHHWTPPGTQNPPGFGC